MWCWLLAIAAPGLRGPAVAGRALRAAERQQEPLLANAARSMRCSAIRFCLPWPVSSCWRRSGRRCSISCLRRRPRRRSGTARRCYDSSDVYYTATSLLDFSRHRHFSRDSCVKRAGLAATAGALPVCDRGWAASRGCCSRVPGAQRVRGMEILVRGSLFRSAYELFYTAVAPGGQARREIADRRRGGPRGRRRRRRPASASARACARALRRRFSRLHAAFRRSRALRCAARAADTCVRSRRASSIVPSSLTRRWSRTPPRVPF